MSDVPPLPFGRGRGWVGCNLFYCMQVSLELGCTAGTYEDAGNTLLFQNPAQGMLSQSTAFSLCLRIPRLQLLK